MKVEIKVPSAGESVSEATVSRILKESGSFVKADEELIELETDKVNQVVYAPAAGQLTLNVQVDQIVTIGSVIGTIDTELQGEETQSQPKPSAEKPKAPPTLPLQDSSTISPTATTSSARQMPSDFLVEPKETSSTFAPANSQEKVSRRRMSGLRRTIAERLVAAKNTTAMLTTFNEVDMSAIIAIRSKEQENFQKKNGIKLGFMSFFVKASIFALKEFPDVHSIIEGDEIVTFFQYDIGVAVSTEKGVFVPVLRHCDQKSFAEIEKELTAFAKKAREGSISVDDIKGGSFTITNGGVFGSLLSTPILNLPQSAILGMHAIVKRPIALNDEVVIRPMMYVALSYDHRIIDGKEAVQFLVSLKNYLEEPARLLLDI